MGLFLMGFSRNHPQMVAANRAFTDYTYMNDSTEDLQKLLCPAVGWWKEKWEGNEQLVKFGNDQIISQAFVISVGVGLHTLCSFSKGPVLE